MRKQVKLTKLISHIIYQLIENYFDISISGQNLVNFESFDSYLRVYINITYIYLRVLRCKKWKIGLGGDQNHSYKIDTHFTL